jgi:L-histidine Nalpha-methyltransferase
MVHKRKNSFGLKTGGYVIVGVSDHSDMKRDVLEGLSASQKQLPCKYFYDARGSLLFEQICLQPEYYQTRTEISILKKAAPVIMADLRPDVLIEFGPGTIQKVRVFLDALCHREKGLRYIPVDVCESVLESAAEEFLTLYPEIEVYPIISDFTGDLEIPPVGGRKLIIFLGSTIGNLNERETLSLLKWIVRLMEPEDRFFLGADMLKPKDILEAAYNDRCGITAEFNRNILNNLNHNLGAHFNLSFFDHWAFYNDNHRHIEMHLRANRDMEVIIDALGLNVTIARGETILTELCKKYSKVDIRTIAAAAGLRIARWFSDSRRWFSLAELALPNYQEK